MGRRANRGRRPNILVAQWGPALGGAVLTLHLTNIYCDPMLRHDNISAEITPLGTLTVESIQF